MDNSLHEDFLKKEEERERWIEYWVVLRNSALYFYDERTDLWQEYCDKIELTSGAKCFAVRRKTYSYRFKLITDEGTWLLKCHTNLQRHRWMHAVESALREISSEATYLTQVVATAPYGCYEHDLYGRSLRREARRLEAAAAARESNNSTLEELSMNLELKQGQSKREAQASRRKSKGKKPPQFKDKHTTVAFKTLQCESVNNSDLGIPVENLAFSDDEVGVDGETKAFRLTSHAPVAKLICVEPK